MLWATYVPPGDLATFLNLTVHVYFSLKTGDFILIPAWLTVDGGDGTTGTTGEIWSVTPKEKVIRISGGPYKVRKKEQEGIKKISTFMQGAAKPHMREASSKDKMSLSQGWECELWEPASNKWATKWIAD